MIMILTELLATVIVLAAPVIACATLLPPDRPR
jgi:hypothetical protein